MPAPDPQALTALPLFRGLPREHRAVLTDLLHARSAPAGALLISAEQPGEVAYLIQAGTAKVCAARPDGAEVIILLRLLSRRLRAATAQIQALATLDVPGRVARQMLIFAEEYGQPEANGAVRIPLRLTQGDLAGMVGATRASVNEVIVTFKQLGYLAVDARQHHIVLDRQALVRRSQ